MRRSTLRSRLISVGIAVFLAVGGAYTPLLLPVGAEAPQAADLTIPEVFHITRPEKELTTTYEDYFITGTSDPDQPVYFNGEEIQRLGTKGVFGVLAQLQPGSNTFRFSQGGETASVTIVRKAPGGPVPISEITQTSMIPRLYSGVKAGGSLSVGCIAPSGATVTARFGGKSVALAPAKEGVAPGLPVSYLGKLPVGGDYDAGLTVKAGKVRYEMSYKGGNKAYESSGEVYVAGEGSEIVVDVAGHLGVVYPSLDQLGTIKETVRTGARDYAKGQSNDYYEIRSGGFIPKEQLRILEGDVNAESRLQSASLTVDGRSETVTFTGNGRPFYDTKIADNTFYLTLYNTAGSPGVNVSGSRIFSGATVGAGESSVTYAFPLGGQVWGYDVAFGEDSLSLRLKYKPSSVGGMTILLDPGHGGADPGALGVAGTTGPAEADVNLAHAIAARDYLAGLGANVILTRTEDAALSLDDRLKLIEQHDADLFLSVQFNSVGENADANKIAGMEVYYHTPLSQSTANRMMDGLAANLNRNNRGVKTGVYRVTLMPYSPSLLLELGFMSNPLEYEKSTTAGEINKVAAAIGEGVKRIVAQE